MATITFPTTKDASGKTRAQSRLGVWLVRGAVGLVVILLALTAAGLVYQAIGSAMDARAHPAPGQLYDVGGYKLHIYCTGPENTGNPTVILETLSGGASMYWTWVQQEIAQTTRVCSYDRAGRAWSEPATRPLSLEQTVGDLRTLLERAGVKPPYVPVGHSIGGLYVRRFAADAPEQVAGMALVDAAHPDQFDRVPSLRAEGEAYAEQSAIFPWVARLGIFRLFFSLGGEIDFQDLPPLQHAQVAALWSSPEYFESQRAEHFAAPQIYRDAHTLGSLGDLPLAVVTQGVGSDSDWMQLQKELAALSSNSIHIVVPGSTHSSFSFNPNDAHAASEAILQVVEAARTGQPLKR
jgi:pimeloyl-ACP methyl ester carboxylesterase